jgi:hypothetical protein
MYEVISAAAGIGLYFIASGGNPVLATAIVGGAALVGLISLVVGIWAGAAHPNIAAVAPRFWTVLLIAIGSAIAWGVIAGSKGLISASTHHGDSAGQAVGLALDLILAGIVARTARLADHVGVEWATLGILRSRYADDVGVFPIGKPTDDPHCRAHKAVHDRGSFNAGTVPVDGWGFRSRRRRFELVADYISPGRPHATPPRSPGGDVNEPATVE